MRKLPLLLAAVLVFWGASAPAQQTASSVTAIDILLEPDATMLRHAEANNARLLTAYSKGFSLDASHRPHITLLQCFVRTAELDQVYAATHKVFAAANLNALKLEAFKYYYAPAPAGLGVAGICAKPTAEMIKLQADIIAAVKPFTEKGGPIGAFTASHGDAASDAALIAYVSTFVPKMSGENFNPHVSTGVAPKDYLDKMLAEPFAKFDFSPAAAAVYQFGPFGSAAKKLKEWDLSARADPLPSWNDTAPKQAIIRFVDKVTKEGSADFVPVAQRIAAFDNDGTLWSEQPMYFQAFFIVDRVKQLAPQHPEWKDREPFASVLKGDLKSALVGGEPALVELAMATHAGMTTDEFEKIVSDWITTAKHPQTGRLYTEMVFQPMLELLTYLRANGFKTYIVSGGGIEFMRPWAERVYGIPPEQVVGSSIKTKYEVRDGQPVLVRLPELNFIDDKAGKPVGIHQHIGRRPIAAFGNSDGDFQMLEWATSGKGLRFGLIVHHTDAEREFAYDRQSHIGKLDKGLDQAPAKGWIVLDMKADWKKIYP